MAQNRSRASEYQVKATYLYNFARFVEWPERAVRDGSSFNICVLGDDPFGPALNEAVANVTVAGKAVAAKRISSPSEAASCRVLFISSSEDARLERILAGLGDASVLTVSDLDQFTQRGGMIRFVLEDHRVHFEVNLAPTERAGLVLSSDLLKVASAVRRNPQHGD